MLGLGFGEISALLFGTGFFGGSLAGTLIGEVLGSKVDAGVCKGFGALRDRVFKPTPENHDLQKAFLRSLRDGIEATTRQQLKTLTQAKALSKPERQQIEDWLGQTIKNLNRPISDVARGWSWPDTEDYGLLLSASAAELSGLETKQIESELRQLKARVEQSLRLEDLPKAFRDPFEQKWLASVYFYLAEAIKTDSRVSQILYAEQLADVQGMLRSLVGRFNQPQQFLGAVQSVDFDVEELRSDIQSWGDRLEGRIAEAEANVIRSVEAEGSRTRHEINQFKQALAIKEGIRQREQVTMVSSANLKMHPPELENWQERNRAIAQLQAGIADTQVRTIGIQGLSGVGKSWLATYVYELAPFEDKFWADVSEHPDFFVFAQNALIKLAKASPEELAQLQEPEQLINKLLDSLKQQRCLLVIDNLETLLDQERCFQEGYRKFFSSWKETGSTSTLLLTTQVQPLVMANHGCWLPLQGLEVEEGVSLLQALKIKGLEAELRDLVELVDGHPAILTLIAKYLIKTGTPNIREAEKLGLKQLDPLLNRVPMAYRDRERVQFVWILEQVFSSLTQKQQDFLLNLSIYGNRPFSREAAAVVLAEETADPWETEQALEELTSRSLLEAVQSSGRSEQKEKQFQFHPFVGQYGLQKAGNPPEELRYKVIAYYQSKRTDSSTWKTLEDVSPQLGIFDQYCELGQYKQAFKAIGQCESFLERWGYNSIRRDLYDQLVQDWQVKVRPEDKSDLGWAWIWLGKAYHSIGKYPRAIEFYEKSLKIAQEMENHLVETNSLGNLGNAYHRLGQHPRAIEFYEKSLKIAQEMGNRQGEASALGNLGNVYHAMGQYPRAIECYQQWSRIAREIKDRQGEASALGNLGIVHWSLGQYQRAIEFDQQLLEFAQQTGYRQGEASALGNLGIVHWSLGQYPQAIDYCQQHLKITQEIGDRQGEADALGNLGNAYSSLGKYPQAINYYQQQQDIAQEIGDRWGEANALGNLGNVHWSLGQYPQAIDYCQQSLEIQQEIGNRQGEASALNNLGNAYNSLGQYQRANDYCQQSLEIQQEIGDRQGEASALGNLGNAYNFQGQYQEAIEFYQQWLKIAQEIKDRRGEASALGNLGNAYNSLGQYQRAINYCEQCLKIAQEIGGRKEEASALGNLGNAYNSLGKYQEAIEFYQRSLKIKQEIGDLRGEADTQFDAGEILAKLERIPEATTAYQNARELYQEMGLDTKVLDCDNAIQRLSRKSNGLVALFRAVTGFLSR